MSTHCNTAPYLKETAAVIPEILLPRTGVDMEKWAVIACDQYTSQIEYWQTADDLVKEAPSTLRITLPEVYLEDEDKPERIAGIRGAMRKYIDEGIFEKHRGIVYVERQTTMGLRKGLVLALDLDRYDYSPNSQSLIRATEGTIIERIPPRVEIRRGAPLETPHIMVLIDDEKNIVIGGAERAKNCYKKLYGFELMKGAGRIDGWLAEKDSDTDAILTALAELSKGRSLLYAVGDGNHSLATAKACYEELKAKDKEAAKTSAARFALVEIVNLHDSALEFEPIHRILFSVDTNCTERIVELLLAAGNRGVSLNWEDKSEYSGDGFSIELIYGDKTGHLIIEKPVSDLAVGILQPALDEYIKESGAAIDYVHGQEAVLEAARRGENLGLILPAMDKSHLFSYISDNGPLPRKTFSMGEAEDKRFYIECRKIC